ncbi:MAG: isoaspartyl peptidase/L-asparaginase [Acidobacteria bacterium]|nr:MAG: isoaspartyl peptidase/L-asparaginase [Acidobacteriota bacterium]REK01876.1 MAG: isoaspartyl peptidase/L-asparaginase [Acidobacteriota bacterium]REK14832.1 MAG: isoaspartyl peptidase/L-asparaginase [Acidobacteriota bacterium]REK45547.1 MAG: isoaspartyl peptidase/L-asparaginase [Acidobacteriota bacterium]
MRKTSCLLAVFALLIVTVVTPAQKTGRPGILQLQSPQNPRLGFVIHGGAGVIRKGSLTEEQEQEYRAKLEEAVLAGYKALKEGKTGLDAVEAAIRILEDSPLFNAGKGAVFTADGKNELDASVMDGMTLNAGAVAGLHRVRNPITLARAVMEKSPHVMMIGEGAEKFAEEMKLELVDPKYFFTQRRWDALQRIIQQEKEKESKASARKFEYSGSEREDPYNKFGTVGAVALDKDGNLAAGTSTGGMTYKKYGRVGDVPVIGAGTYADNNTCAVSATGWGEFFIRLSVARDIAALMEYRALPVQQAADIVIQQKLQKAGGDGGVIAIDKFGNIGISFNSEGMYRAYIDKDGKPVVEIYGDQ